MRVLPTAVLVALSLGMTVTARAGTIASPILSAGAGGGGGSLHCTVSNLDTKPTSVTVTLLDFNGDVLAAGDNCALVSGGMLEPGESCNSTLSGGNTARCTVVTGSSKVRAVFAVRDSAFNITAAVPLTKK